MTLPVLDQQGLSGGNDTSADHIGTQITTLTDDEIVIVEYSSAKTNGAQIVNSVDHTGTATLGAWSKLFEVSNANNCISVWWAHQSVKGTITTTVHVNVGNVSATLDGWAVVTSSYTGANASQAAAAFASTTQSSTTAGPLSQAVTTTAANSLVRSLWNDSDTPAGGDGNGLNTGSTAQRWFDAFGSMTVSQFFASYTGSTASPGSTTQTYNGFTSPSFKGAVAAYEILGAGESGGTVNSSPLVLIAPDAKTRRRFRRPVSIIWDANPTRNSANAITATVSAVASNASSGQTWKPLKLGAGGYITGIVLSTDGVGKYIRTDTYGCYRLVGSTWQQLVTSTSMPVGDILPNSQIGVYAIAVAPSTSSRVYMAWRNSVYRSDNSGDTWTVTALTGKTFDPNNAYRYSGRKMIVDPANPDVVYFGVPNDGLYTTTNGGTSWSLVSSGQVPTAGAAGYLGMAFDSSGGTASSKTKNIYVWSHGQGLYRTTNGGTTWTNLTGGPNLATLFVTRAAVDTTGIYHACVSSAFGGSGVVWRYTPSGNTWFQSTTNTDYGAHGIAVDPANNNHVVFARMDGGGLAQSNDGGATYDVTAVYPAGASWTTADVPWLDFAYRLDASSGDIVFDPIVANKMWRADGIGVYNATVTYGLTTIPWHALSAGIEQLVVNKIIAPPSGDISVAVWDRATFLTANPDTYPSSYKPSNAFDATWDIDYAGGTPSFIVASHSDNRGQNLLAGYSTNSGVSWITYPTMPLGATSPYTYGFGDMAVSPDTQHIVWIGTVNKWPYYTANRGSLWTAVTISGLTQGSTIGGTAVEAGFLNSYYANRRILTADKVTSNTFYLFWGLSLGGDPAATQRGFYKSTDGGANWSRVFNAPTNGVGLWDVLYWATFNAQLESVPGKAGHLFFTGGPVGSAPDSLTSDGYRFIRSTDAGTTWSAVPNINEVYCFGFGAPRNVGGYPAVFIVGWNSGVYGVWRSDDADQATPTWTSLGTWPLNDLDWTTCITGDMDIYGRCFVGFRGSGAAYRDSGALTGQASALTATVTVTAYNTAFKPQTATVTASAYNATVITAGSANASTANVSVSASDATTTGSSTGGAAPTLVGDLTSAPYLPEANSSPRWD